MKLRPTFVNCCQFSRNVVDSQAESSITSPNSIINNQPNYFTNRQPNTYMYLFGHKFKIIDKKTKSCRPVDSCRSCRLTSIKYIKQFRKWLEARTNQHTARKAWSDYIVICYLKNLNLTCDRKLLLYIDINPTYLNYRI